MSGDGRTVILLVDLLPLTTPVGGTAVLQELPARHYARVTPAALPVTVAGRTLGGQLVVVSGHFIVAITRNVKRNRDPTAMSAMGRPESRNTPTPTRM
jgi:hypothetical protein